MASVYRDLNFLMAQKACIRHELQGCSQELVRFLMTFPALQQLRHQVDYDPITCFKQGEALSAADDAECTLIGLQPALRDEDLDIIIFAKGITRS